MLFLFDTGVRAQHLVDLLVGDVDLKAGAVQVRHGKGDKGRVVYVGAVAKDALWRSLSRRSGLKNDQPLFETAKHRPLDTDALRHMLQAAGERAGISEPVTPHRFRHTFAITYLRNGGSPLELQALPGHEKPDTVNIYVRLAQVDLQRAQKRASPADNWQP